VENVESAETLIPAILGLVAPYLISFLKNAKWSVREKVALALLVCAGFGTISVYVTGDLNPESWIKTIALVYTVSNTFYKTYFESTPANKKLEDKLHPPTQP